MTTISVLVLISLLILLTYKATDFSQKSQRNKPELNALVIVGFIITFLFILGVSLLGNLEYCDPQAAPDCTTKFQAFLNDPPNEIGDTLAGLAGALAFLWIIITVILQSKELSEQRKELKRTRKEFKKMSKAQDEQVHLLTMQGEIFQEEQSQRRQILAKNNLDELLRSFCLNLSKFKDEEWHFKLPSQLEEPGTSRVSIAYRLREGNSIENEILQARERFKKFLSELNSDLNYRVLVKFPARIEFKLSIIEPLLAAVVEKDKLSEAERIRVNRLQISLFLEELLEFHEDRRFWSVSEQSGSQK
ncbi:hypothetical protein [Heliomarina baculiformis]|uniref:hypothetical protein n=1 Tax=Heliomarina baculiformis TaxID=2872036 RepID=UPI001EE21B5B|nr:hypothetical protein [Heliomarina baculiformis]